MGKLPNLYTDSEDTENAESSVENLKKKKKPSILKYSAGNVKKKKCRIHSRSEPEDSDARSRSGSRTSHKMSRLKGILKGGKDRQAERYGNMSSDEESEPEAPKLNQSVHRYLVGRVPRPSGSKPGRGGGLAIIVKKNANANSSGGPAEQYKEEELAQAASEEAILLRKCSSHPVNDNLALMRASDFNGLQSIENCGKWNVFHKSNFVGVQSALGWSEHPMYLVKII